MHIATTHKNADFDALASLVAATLLYPEVIPVLPKSINPNVKSFLSIHKDLFATCSTRDIDVAKVSRLVVVDANSWNRLDGMDRLKERRDLEILLWDHHPLPGDIRAAMACQEVTGANITLMIRDLKKAKKRLSPIQSTLFLAGLYEDTGNLSFSSTTAEDAYVAAYLLKRGADLNIVNSLLRPAYNEKQRNILFDMLQKASRTRVNGYKVSISKAEVSGHVGGLAVVVGMYREILNVDAAFGIFSDANQDKCIVIGRSATEELDVGSILRSMGGGGHPGAGSALLKAAATEAVQEWILELIQGNQQSSVQLGDLMSFPVVTVLPDTPMEKVALILREKGCTGLPVVDDGRLVGMISRRDFLKVKKASQMQAPAKAFMSKNVISTEPRTSPMQAARLMIKHDVGRLPVVEKGKIIGIFTRSDAMTYFYDLLPD